MNVLHSSNQRYAEDLEGWHEWIGRKVCISGTKPGILKYFGHTEFADGIWCGVELNEPIGKNNGSVKGVQYFTCKENHGIFVSVAKVEKVQEKITWNRNSDGQKKLKNRRFTLHSGPSQGKIGNILPDEDTYISQSDKRRKTTFFKFPNNDVSGVPVTSHSQKPQLNNSYVISSENNLTENADDILNKTVVLTDENMVNQDDQGNVSTNKIYSESNSVLNATFDINNLQATEMANNNKEIVLDGTFVLGEQNLESTEEQICSSASDRANFNTPENNKSLGILSLSQMKDFTICTEPFINDTNVKLQNPQLSDLCNNSKMPPKSDNRAVSQVSSSGFFQTDLELFQENTVFEDFVFLNNETGNGNNLPYRGPERSPQEVLFRNLSDEVKDICFEPTHHQSSTPSEESKQMFSKRMSLIKSFHLDDSFKVETKHYNSSTPYKPAAPLELMSKMDILDMPVQSVEDSLGNVNVSLIDDQIIPSTFLDTTRSTEEPLQKEKKKSDDLHVLDLVSHPVKAGDIPSVYDDSSNGRKSLGEAASKFDLQKMCSIVSHSSGLFLESSKPTVDTNLNITQELGSNVKRSSLSESNTAVFEIPTENIQDVKCTQEGSSFLKDEAFSVSKVHAAVSKPVDSVEKVISVIKKGSDSGDICESVSGSSSNSLYCVQKLGSQGTNSDAQDVSEMVKKTESGVLHQTFNYNSSYTVPLNSSYTLGGNEVNKNEDNALNREMTATSKASNESECSLVIDQLHNAPCKEFLPSENSTNSKKDCVLEVPQNLNATVCISSNINSHNLTFDVTENLKPETVKANRSNSNVCTNLTRQSVGPVLPRNSKIMPSATRSRSALVTNSSKPCVPNNNEQTMSNKFADSLKQNTVQSQKPPNRRYSAASRIVSQENKMQPKNQVVSKIDTNLKASRLSLPKQSLGLPTNAKKQLDADNSVFKVPDSKAIKNVLNYQRLRQDARKENGLDGSQKYPPGKRNVITPQNSENKSLILKENTQAVNVPAQNNENGLPAPSLSRRSSIQSVSSQSSSKIAVFNKNNTSKSNETKDFSSKNDQKLNASTHHQTVGIPPSNQKLNTSRSPKLNDSANSQKSAGSNAKEKQNLMVKKPEISRVSGRLSESAGIKRSIPRRTCLPKLKPVQQC